MGKRSLHLIIVTGHSSLESGGVGTHLKVLKDSLDDAGISNDLILGRELQHKVMARVISALLSLWWKRSHSLIEYVLLMFALRERLEAALMSSNKGRARSTAITVHVHDHVSAIAATLLKSQYQFRLVQTLHAPVLEHFGLQKVASDIFIFNKMLHLGQRSIDAYIAVDSLQKEILVADKDNLLDSSIHVIPNAVDMEHLSRIRAAPSERPYIIVARNLHRKCGVHVAIDAFIVSGLAATYDLIIVGEGAERRSLEKSVSDAELLESVKFLGKKPRETTLSLIKGSTLSLVPSIPLGRYIEATSLTMLESMALGAPVIASRVGGLAEALDNTDAGILFEPGDHLELARIMNSLCNNKKRRDEIKAAAHELVSTKYSNNVWLAKHLDVYKQPLPSEGFYA